MTKTLIIATRNPHKVQEIRELLGDEVRCLTLNDFPGAPPVVEDAGSFTGNATKKAVELSRWLSRTRPTALENGSDPGEVYCLADDSGLEVDALQGAPGVHSARFAALGTGGASNSSDADNNRKLLQLLQSVSVRTARFRCCIALTPVTGIEPATASPVCAADEAELRTQLFEGVCEGEIEHQPRGSEGFGYDPLFRPAGHQKTFGELGAEVKNQISHRAKALAHLKSWLSRNSSGDCGCSGHGFSS